MTQRLQESSPSYQLVNDTRLDEMNFDPVALEDLCVHKVYDSIAEEFSSTRHSPWPGVVEFLQKLPFGAFGADIGCGNGKYLLAAVERLCSTGSARNQLPRLAPILALDRSVRLSQIVRERGFDVVVGDILRLPYRLGRLDFFLCIAVIHHLSTSERRLNAIRELAGLLRPGGQGLIQVWAKEQRDPTTAEPAPYIRKKKLQTANPAQAKLFLEPVQNMKLPVHLSGTEFVASDMLVPWKRKATKADQTSGVTVEPCEPVPGRYYHLFVQGELESLIMQIPSLELHRVYYERGNWAAIVNKISMENTDSS